MSVNAAARSGVDPFTAERPRAVDTILYGGLVVGVLDGLDAVVFNALMGTSPIRVFQFVASGLLGRASFGGGLMTALLGTLLHFLVAFVVAAVYYRASLSLPALLRQAVMWGVIYGVAVYLVMNYLVLPVSAAPKIPFTFASLLNGVVGHALLVGLPIALFARQSAKAKQR